MNQKLRREIPVALVVAAALLLVAFHFLPGDPYDPKPGWTVWVELWQIARDPQWLLTEPLGAIAVAGFLTFSVVLVASPFLTPVLRKSRIPWLGLTILSGLSGGGFWVAMFIDHPPSPSPALWCLLVANPLNFIGLLTIRWGSSQASPLGEEIG